MLSNNDLIKSLKRINMKTRLTDQQKEQNKLERQKAKREAQELARINAEKNQKEVAEITITIDRVRSRTWGSNPHCEAVVRFKDGTSETSPTYKCSGCGYDKESTVIADVFNAYLKYKLHRIGTKGNRSDKKDSYPYGMYLWPDTKCFNGGVGTSCYYAISEYIGGKFEKVSSGKTFDVYKYTDIEGAKLAGEFKEENPFSGIALVAAMGEIFGTTKEEKNSWKKRMLKAGLGEGLNLPDDFDSLPEDEKERRLNGAIEILGNKK